MLRLAVPAVFCFLYLVGYVRNWPAPILLVLKPAPILLASLTTLQASKPGPRPYTAVATAFFLSAIGDIFLHLRSGHPEFAAYRDVLFLCGLGSFLVAHLFFTASFVRDISSLRPVSLAVVLTIGWGLFWFVFEPKMKQSLKIPVALYCTVIVVMCQRAFVRLSLPAKFIPSATLALIGACVFGLSDFTIAINEFVQPFDQAHLVVMVTYYSAQNLFLASMLKWPTDSQSEHQGSSGKKKQK
eukprot:c52440_g1_i1.p1 GENE.c52440_g1_i1~~c52440_g1_i1.p1  ORF type:complete len:242 (+),score=48.83 c52440_g1_i1:37-762(+)